MQPLVSIILPCYNSESFLKYSLESVIDQDYKNLEIICINDGSTDNTLDMLRDYQKTDGRIVIIDNEKNLGLISSLNNALSYVNGDYFARMDADDFSTFDRISEQVKFMENNQDFDVVSSAYNYFHNDNQKEKYILPIATKPNALKFLSIFCTPLTHASVLGKSSLIRKGLYVYDLSFPYAEDFELFSRLARDGVKIGMMEKSLYHVRLHTGSVSVRYKDIQVETNIKIIQRNIKSIGLVENIDEKIAGLLACKINTLIHLNQIKQAFSIFDKCLTKEKNILTKDDLIQIDSYLSLHKLNILIQVNKYRFSNLGCKNGMFFLSSLFLLNRRHFKLIYRKIAS